MKKRLRFIAVFLSACVVFIAVMVLLFQREGASRAQPNISVVVYGTADRWTSLEQGVGQAAGSLGTYAPTLVTTDPLDPNAQLAAIEREIQNGAEALIIAASDSDAMLEPLRALAADIPIVFVETGVGGSLDAVQTDNTALGLSLAEALAGREDIVILDQNRNRDSVDRRYEALIAGLDELSTPYTVWSNNGSSSLSNFLLRNLVGQGSVTLVTLDAETSEAAVDALTAEGLDTDVQLYAVGGTDKIVHALDRGLATQIWYENEYNIGYIAYMQAAGRLGHPAPQPDGSISFLIVTGENMYEADIERLLFPIIQ